MGAAPSLVKDPQSIVHEKGDDVNGDIRRNTCSPDNLVATFSPEVTTLFENFEVACKNAPNSNFLGVRNGEEYVWQSYETARKTARSFGSGLAGLGCVAGTKIGVYAKNMPEWTISGQACNAYSLVSVSLYDTLGEEAVAYIINQAEIPVAIVSKIHVKQMLEGASSCPCLKIIIQIQDITADQGDIKQEAESANVRLLTFREVVEMGENNPVDVRPPKPDDLATLCYTSGTTGNPKGVMLTHGNLIADLAGALAGGLTMDDGEIHISYLPLAHMFERIVQEAMICTKSAIGFFQGDITKLMEDIAVLRPTIFPSVPRLFNRLYDKVHGAVNEKGGISKKLFGMALEVKKEGLKDGYLTHAIWDSVVFGKVRSRLGGRVKYLVTGSAPLSPEVTAFLKSAFSCPLLEGYGQTECAAACTLTAANDPTIGHVGAPLPCNEIKLVSVPDMDYNVSDKPNPRGEVCIRGPNVCKGYYNMPEKTAETIDSDGWLHTGDIGLWLPNGTLKIIDRKKNLFKLAQGEYVAPEKCENKMQRSAFVAQIFVHGNSLKASLLGVIVPDFETLTPWAKANGLESIAEDEEALCANEEVKAMILADLRAIGKEGGLKGFEIVRGIVLSHIPFSVENNTLTATFK